MLTPLKLATYAGELAKYDNLECEICKDEMEEGAPLIELNGRYLCINCVNLLADVASEIETQKQDMF